MNSDISDPISMQPVALLLVADSLGIGQTPFLRKVLPLLQARHLEPFVLIHKSTTAYVNVPLFAHERRAVMPILGNGMNCDSVVRLMNVLLENPLALQPPSQNHHRHGLKEHTAERRHEGSPHHRNLPSGNSNQSQQQLSQALVGLELDLSSPIPATLPQQWLELLPSEVLRVKTEVRLVEESVYCYNLDRFDRVVDEAALYELLQRPDVPSCTGLIGVRQKDAAIRSALGTRPKGDVPHEA